MQLVFILVAGTFVFWVLVDDFQPSDKRGTASAGNALFYVFSIPFILLFLLIHGMLRAFPHALGFLTKSAAGMGRGTANAVRSLKEHGGNLRRSRQERRTQRRHPPPPAASRHTQEVHASMHHPHASPVHPSPASGHTLPAVIRHGSRDIPVLQQEREPGNIRGEPHKNHDTHHAPEHRVPSAAERNDFMITITRLQHPASPSQDLSTVQPVVSPLPVR